MENLEAFIFPRGEHDQKDGGHVWEGQGRTLDWETQTMSLSFCARNLTILTETLAPASPT